MTDLASSADNLEELSKVLIKNAYDEIDKILEAILKISRTSKYFPTIQKVVKECPITFSSSLAQIGLAHIYPPPQRIDINTILCLPNNRIQLYDTVAHELAHIITFNLGLREVAHGKNWKMIAKLLGSTPDAIVADTDSVIQGYSAIRRLKRKNKLNERNP